MHLPKERAVDLLNVLGVLKAPAAKLKVSHVQKELDKLPEREIPSDHRMEDEELEDLKKKVLSAYEEGEDVIVEGQDVEEKPKKGKNGDKKPSASANGRVGKVRPSKSPASKDLDPFGARKDTNKARIHAALNHEPQTMKEIMEKAGVKSTHYNHLKSLAEQGKIVREKDGRFRLGSKSKRPSSKSK